MCFRYSCITPVFTRRMSVYTFYYMKTLNLSGSNLNSQCIGSMKNTKLDGGALSRKSVSADILNIHFQGFGSEGKLGYRFLDNGQGFDFSL